MSKAMVISDSELLSRMYELGKSETFLRECVPGLLLSDLGTLRVLYLAAICSPECRARLEAEYTRTLAPRVPTFVVCPGTDKVTVAEYKKADKEGRESVERLLLDRGYTRK